MRRSQWRLRPLVIAVCLGSLCHVVLLAFERPIIVGWVRDIAARDPFDEAGVGWILIAHLIVNISVGALYSALARPPSLSNSLVGCGLAAGLPNTLCTATGALLVVSSELPRLSDQIGISLRQPGLFLWLSWTIVAVSILTGIIVAPFGMLDGYLAARVGGRSAS